MAKKRRKRNTKIRRQRVINQKVKRKRAKIFILPTPIKQKILGALMILGAIIVALSFFDLAGIAGKAFMKASSFLVGKVVFSFPLFLVLAGLILWENLSVFKQKWWLAILAILIFIIGITGILGSFRPELKLGGWIGYLISWPFLHLFEFWVTIVIFGGVSAIGGIIIFYPLWEEFQERKAISREKERVALVKKEILPHFKIKEISPSQQKISLSKQSKEESIEPPSRIKLKQIPVLGIDKKYQPPSCELLESEKKGPKTDDIRVNAAVIKRTLQNFNIPVEMGQVNIGPTVTQYTLKPAEGIKLSKITSLANDLALALASHPIRIEAPIPGKSLVGIEVPNRVRGEVRLRDLIENPAFLNSSSRLTFVLGRDVSGTPAYADLARMPHLLVAGSTGSGKTVFLNDLILSLIYRNSPRILKFILIDPKRVEFPVYNGIPHLLGSVVCTAREAVGALQWLIEEMERRFDIFSQAKTKDINSYNEQVINGSAEPIPYIILIIDELADLMAAKGREVEGGIVRLAQMARAVGIHLVVATQRPSVEVITGLIKANITSRIAFQVASQVDSRTVFDMAGAERLLGRGDMLFISAEVSKPKRIQAPLVTEKEVKRVVKFLKSQTNLTDSVHEQLSWSLKKKLSETEEGGFSAFSRGEDPLYETAKQVVIEAGRASASLLQRRLQIGYARAARLIDMLEERGVVGPPEGSKPRKVYGESQYNDIQEEEFPKE